MVTSQGPPDRSDSPATVGYVFEVHDWIFKVVDNLNNHNIKQRNVSVAKVLFQIYLINFG